MVCKGDCCNAKDSCWRREVFLQVTAGSWLVLVQKVELLVLFTGFSSPWFVQHLPWCLGALGGQRGTPATPPKCLPKEARAAGGSKERAARREPLGTGTEGEDSEKKAGKMQNMDLGYLKERETTKY